MNSKLVSVIIPCYNYGDYIELCIRSVLDQTYAHLEVIVVDDGSSDHSLKVIREVAASDDRVRVMAQENTGVALARNRGIEASRGSMILFVDADDELLPEFLEKTVACLMDSGENCFVYTQYKMHGVVERVSNCGAFSTDRLKESNFVGICALHWKRNLEGVRFDPRLDMDEDYDFILSVAKKGIKGVLWDEVLVSKRQHEASRNTIGQLDLRCLKTRLLIVGNHRDFFTSQEAEATLLNAKLAAVRAIRNRRKLVRGRWNRIVEFAYMLRYVRFPRELLVAFGHVFKG